MAEIRECRLRPEYDHLYEAVPAGVWRRAREVAELLVARASEARRLSLQERTFDARHFEFRGGLVGARPPSWRTRAGDKPPPPSPETDPRG
ncbi:MAG: hypothetical protein ABJC36_11255 [Gemmatimonadales bacterium]